MQESTPDVQVYATVDKYWLFPEVEWPSSECHEHITILR